MTASKLWFQVFWNKPTTLQSPHCFPTMPENCLSLGPFGECGPRGTCVRENVSGSEGFGCVCDPGWFTPVEMGVYFLDKEEILFESAGMCTENEILLTTLYWFSLVTTFIALLYQLFNVGKKRHLYRIFPYLSGNVLQIILCSYKISNLEKSNIGDDFLFTFFVFNTFFLFLISVSVFFEKYIFYIIGHTKLKDARTIQKAKFFSKGSKYIFISDFFLYQLAWTTVFMERPLAYNAIRVVYLSTLFRTFYTLLMVETLFGTLIKDMKTYIALEESRNLPLKEKQSKSMLNKVNYYSVAKRNLPRIMLLRRVSVLFGCFYFVFGFLTGVLPFLMYLFGYAVPIVLFCWNIVCLISIRSRAKRRSESHAVQNEFDVPKEQVPAIESQGSNPKLHDVSFEVQTSNGAESFEIKLPRYRLTSKLEPTLTDSMI
eukprot:maker-scaffold_38-snap-gene-0.40-mRNA-1 protein AED:0.05 eAED:0.11 QI:0/0/0.5/1/0/0/2/74/428